MIRVVITGPAQEGSFPYRIETPGTRLAVPVHGFAADPLYDACLHLRELEAAEDKDTVGLFERGSRTASQWKLIGSVSRFEPFSDGMTARSSARLLPPNRFPEPLADTGPAGSGSDKPVRLHRKRQRAGSGGRRGRR